MMARNVLKAFALMVVATIAVLGGMVKQAKAQAGGTAVCKTVLSNYLNQGGLSSDSNQDGFVNVLDWAVACGTQPGALGQRLKIVFSSGRDGNLEIYMMNDDGSEVTRLTNHPARDAMPAFSPDNSKIVFVSDRDGDNEIYTMNLDGTNLKQLTHNTINDQFPSFSPDGKKIVYSATTGISESPVHDIYLMDADTGANNTRLTTSTYLTAKFNPSFSHDGKYIIYVRGWSRTYIMSADGSNPIPLTANDDSYQLDPRFSPNDQKIIFRSLRQPPPSDPFSKVLNNDIFLINRDGTNEIQLTTDQGEDVQPMFSPNGSKIVFASNRGHYEDYDIYIMNVDGSGVTNLTNNPKGDLDPHFSYGPVSCIAEGETCGNTGQICCSGLSCVSETSGERGRCVLSEPTVAPLPNNSPCTTGSQCQSGKCGQDSDGDNYFVSGPGICQGSDKIAGDCYDTNANAHPGQTSYYYIDRGDGSFDYNCDNTQEKNPTTNCLGTLSTSVNACTTTRPTGHNGYENSIPDCGQAEPWRDCSLYPENACTALVAVTGINCNAGCSATNWDGTPIASWKVSRHPGWTMACR